MAVFSTDFLGQLFVRHIIEHLLPVCWIKKYEQLHIKIFELDRSDADRDLKGGQDGAIIHYGNQSNLAIKGIIAIKAMSKMSLAAGHVTDADKYSVCNDPPD
jgi:hypothetical protein